MGEGSNSIEIKNFPVNLDVNTINEAINKIIKEHLTNGSFNIVIDEKKKIALKPDGDILIKAEDLNIHCFIPLVFEGDADLPLADVSVSGNINIHAFIQIAIDEKLNIKTRTEIQEITWRNGPNLNPPVVDFIIPDQMVKNLLDRALPFISDKIDEKLNELLVIDQILKKIVWTRVVEIPLKNNLKLRYLARPKELEVYRITADNKGFKVIANAGLALIYLPDGLPEPEIDQSFMPTIHYLAVQPIGGITTFQFNLSIGELNEPVFKAITSIGTIEKAIRCSIEKVIVRGVNGEGLAVALKLSGALNGGLSIAGKPSLEPQSGMMNIDNLTFDFSSKGVWNSLTGNIALSFAKSYIRKQFPIDLKPYISAATVELNNAIANLSFNDLIELKGKTEQWQIDQLKINDNNLTISISSRLNLYLV